MCSFSAEYTGDQPLPGSVTASVSVAGGSASAQAAATPYDFATAVQTQVGAVATVSNYFESGDGILQPYGVQGQQPPPGLQLEDSRTFEYTALFGNVDASKCGQTWKVRDCRRDCGLVASQPLPWRLHVMLTRPLALTACDCHHYPRRSAPLS